jgi:hypothetical protein
LWLAFIDLSNHRTPGMMSGVGRISEADIYYYCSNRRLKWEAWQIKTIQRLDEIVYSYLTKPKPEKPADYKVK